MASRSAEREEFGSDDRSGTRDRLLSAATQALAKNPSGPVKLTEVLSEAKASPSSLYHFFGSLSGLVQEAKITRFEEAALVEAYDALRAGVVSATSREQVADAVDMYLEHLAGDTRTSARHARASAVLAASNDEDVQRRLLETQSHLYDALTEVLSTGIHKGFVSADVDMLGFVHFTDALFFGYLLSETLGREDLKRAWYGHARVAIYVALFGDEGLALSRRA